MGHKIHNIFYDKGTKYKSIIIGHQVPNKNNLARHKEIVHDTAKYPYRQFGHQAYSKGILLNTKDQYMKDSITHAGNVTLSILKGESILS